MVTEPAKCALLGPYVVSDKVAWGGMATIHLGRRRDGRGRGVVAVKRLRPELVGDHAFVEMFLDEARLSQRIHHPNVVETVDIGSSGNERYIVMSYVHGESLSYLLRTIRKNSMAMPVEMAGHIIAGMLDGLHAAHEAVDERGAPLGLIHRDVSPHNVLVGIDGRPMLIDFGVAKARGRLHKTRQGQIKGKLQYMSPEQIRGKPLDRRTDVFSAGIVLWEMLSGEHLFQAEDDATMLGEVLRKPIPSLVGQAPGVSDTIDAVVQRALQRDANDRFSTARDMAEAIRSAFPAAASRSVGLWVSELASKRLARKVRIVDDVERWASEVRALLQDAPMGTAMLPPDVGKAFDASPSTTAYLFDSTGSGPYSGAGTGPSSVNTPSALTSTPVPSSAQDQWQSMVGGRPAVASRPTDSGSMPSIPDLDLPPSSARAGSAAAIASPAGSRSAPMSWGTPPAGADSIGGLALDKDADPFELDTVVRAPLSDEGQTGSPAVPSMPQGFSPPPLASSATSQPVLSADVATRAEPAAQPSPTMATRRQIVAIAPPPTYLEPDPEPTGLRRYALAVKLIIGGLFVSVLDITITRATGVSVGVGPLRPSLVAGLLVAAGVLFGIFKAVQQESSES